MKKGGKTGLQGETLPCSVLEQKILQYQQEKKNYEITDILIALARQQHSDIRLQGEKEICSSDPRQQCLNAQGDKQNIRSDLVEILNSESERMVPVCPDIQRKKEMEAQRYRRQYYAGYVGSQSFVRKQF